MRKSVPVIGTFRWCKNEPKLRPLGASDTDDWEEYDGHDGELPSMAIHGHQQAPYPPVLAPGGEHAKHKGKEVVGQKRKRDPDTAPDPPQDL